MGLLDRWRGVRDVAVAETFAVDRQDVPPMFYGLTSYADPIAPSQRVSRAEAIQVGAVKRARDIVAGTLGGLPLAFKNSDFVVQPNALLSQPEPHIPRSVTMAMTVDDLLFEGKAWWRVIERNHPGYPTKVRRLEPRTVTVTDDQKVFVRPDGAVQGTAWVQVEDRDLIRFYSPNDALLVAGSRAIRTLLMLDSAAARYADEPMPQGVFTPADDVEDLPPEEVQEFLDSWEESRRRRSTAYVNGALRYSPMQWDPAQLQLVESRRAAVIEIARIAGIDPEDLGVSTTSRTYLNGTQKREELIDYTLSPYATAIQDRLSMGDVTPRGYIARFDYGGFAKADEATRVTTYTAGVELGLYDVAEVQRREELPPYKKPTPKPVAPAVPLHAVPPINQQEGPPLAAQRASGERFDAEPAHFGFDQEDGRLAFEVDVAKREIFGLAVPYGVPTTKNGRTYQFSQGSLSWKAAGRVKLLDSHDRSKAVGTAKELTDTPEGLWARFGVARGAEGDRILQLAEDKVYDGLSIGLGVNAQFALRDGVHHATSAPLAEVSILPFPSFDDARVSSVAASADEGNITMPCTVCGLIHTAGVPCAGSPAPAPTFDSTSIVNAIRDGFAAQTGTGPQVISATGGSTVSVTEELPYRFDGVRGEHDFSTDLFGSHKGNGEAASRLAKFMDEIGPMFNVAQTNVTGLNPSPTRPELYVDQQDYLYPLWRAISKGTLTDNTPFIVPKFNSSSGLVGNHTEGTEPTTGSFTATTQTITPAAVSGKATVNREVIDAGGSPQVSTLIWRQMIRGYYEALEAYAVATLDAVTPTGITLTTAEVDKALAKDIAGKFAALQYIRGGFRFDTFPIQIDLYLALANATDDSGRPLFPMINPMNANGTMGVRFGSMNINGVNGFPEWALAATGTVAASSYLFDSTAVSGWASAPRRFDFQYQVATVDIAIWGYKAAAVTDLTGVREVIYDPS